MGKIYKGFIQSNGKGSAYGPWKDVKNLSDTFSDDWYCGLGVLSDEVVLLDFDNEDSYSKGIEIVKKYDLKPKLNHNNHHMLFRKPQGMNFKRSTHQLLYCGIECDFLVSHGVECLKKDGKIRFDKVNNDVSEIDELPYYFYPLVFSPISKWNTINFNAVGLEDDGGRYDLLYSLRLALLQKGLTEEQVINVLDIINTIVFNEKLDVDNWNRIIDFKSIDKDQFLNYAIKQVNKNGTISYKFLPYLFVVDNMEKLHVVKHNNTAIGYVNGKWYDIINYFDTLLTKLFKDNERQEYSKLVRKQLLSLINYDLTKSDDIDWNNPRYMVFNNGTYDWDTNTIIPTEWNHFQTVTVPFDIVENPESEYYDILMKRIFGDDEEQKRAVLECIGSGFYKENRTCKYFNIFHGEGDNAKSLFTDAIIKICGAENISGVALSDMDKRFSYATMYGKLFNIIDDANADYVGNTGNLKTIATGGRVLYERKGKDAFYPSENAFITILLNSNSEIRIGNGDDAYSIKKRRRIVHFTRQFKKNDKDYDKDACIKALNDVSFLQKLLWESIQAFGKIKDSGNITLPKSSVSTINKFDDLMVQQENTLKLFNPEDWCKYNIQHTYEFYCQNCGTKNPKSLPSMKNMILKLYPDLQFSDKYQAFYSDKPLEGMNYNLVKEVWYPTLTKSEIIKKLKFDFGLEPRQSTYKGKKIQKLYSVINE